MRKVDLSNKDRDLIGFGFWVVLSELQDLRQKIHSFEKRVNMDAASIQQKLADQQAAIENDTNAVSSASGLLDQLADLIRNNVTDQTALQAIADSIDSNNTTLSTNNQTLSEAVARNTPAEPSTP